MAVQVSYPGVYIDEFAPGAPIQGVGTSTVAFIGVAAKGPINRPTLIDSWDAFVRTFGDFLDEPGAYTAPGRFGYLAPAVYGFFLNGGTQSYVVRAGTGQMASADLDSRQAGPNPDPVLVARALQEGPAGNAITVQVADSSRLAAALTRVLGTRNVTAAVSADRLTVTVDSNAGYAGGEAITIAAGAASEDVVVARIQDADKLVLAAAIPGAADFNGGTVVSRGILALRRVQTDVAAVSANRLALTVASSTGFAPGDRVLVAKAADSAVAVVDSIGGPTSLVLTAPLAGAVDYTGGTVRSADLVPGQRTFRVASPSGMSLGPVLPRGSAIRLTLGATTEILTVQSAGGDALTVAEPLANGYSLAAAGDPPVVASLEFDLTITDAGSGQTEPFTQLSMNPDHPAYWGSTVTSELVTIEEPPSPPAPMPADRRPVAAVYPLGGGTPDDRAAAWVDVRGDPVSYLDQLRPIDEVAIVCIPGATDDVVQQAMIAHCEDLYDRVALLDPVFGATPGNGIRDQFADVRSERGFAALYYPWILARNPVTRRNELWPPSGHLAGIWARVDASRGVHKAPANTTIRGAVGLERQLTNEQQGPLNLMGINVLRVFPGQSQPTVWGARTTATDRNWMYLNVRRLFNFMEESISEGIRWAIFEPNNLELWQKLKLAIGDFMTQVWRDGGLFGESADRAFYVRIDEALNPPSTLALGRLYIEVGARPTYPAEFIILRIGIWQGGSEVSES